MLIKIITAITMAVVPSRTLAAYLRKVDMPKSNSALQRVEAKGVDMNSWLPPIFNRPKRQDISDKVALDAITLRLSEQVWDSDTPGVVAEIVRRTGRVVNDIEDF